MKHKWSASVGYWVQYVTLTLYLTHDFDLNCFKVKFRNSSISGIVGFDWCEMETRWVNMILGQLYDLAIWPHHDLDLGVEISRSASEIALSQEWEADWHGTKRMWVVHSWPWCWQVWPWWGGRMFRIVTSDVGVPSTYLVGYWKRTLVYWWWLGEEDVCVA